MADRADLPTIEDETREYWTAAADGKLLIARCGSCSRVHHYPRVICPFCWSDDVTAVEASGNATLYTHSTVELRTGMPLRAEPQVLTDDVTIIVFRPVSA